ncbi:hypothetical protein EI555_011682, partial [Monodon monoceros]
TVVTGFHHKTKACLAHFLPQGTLVPLIPVLAVIKTISLFIQPTALAILLTANVTAGPLLIHLIGRVTLALLSISTTTALITFPILVLLTILKFTIAIILISDDKTSSEKALFKAIIHQASEYYETSFTISDGVYRSTFFIATGFHRLRVTIGSSLSSASYIN